MMKSAAKERNAFAHRKIHGGRAENRIDTFAFLRKSSLSASITGQRSELDPSGNNWGKFNHEHDLEQMSSKNGEFRPKKIQPKFSYLPKRRNNNDLFSSFPSRLLQKQQPPNDLPPSFFQKLSASMPPMNTNYCLTETFEAAQRSSLPGRRNSNGSSDSDNTKIPASMFLQHSDDESIHSNYSDHAIESILAKCNRGDEVEFGSIASAEAHDLSFKSKLFWRESSLVTSIDQLDKFPPKSKTFSLDPREKKTSLDTDEETEASMRENLSRVWSTPEDIGTTKETTIASIPTSSLRGSLLVEWDERDNGVG